MRNIHRAAIWVAALLAAAAITAGAASAVTDGTSNTRRQSGVSTSARRYLVGFSTSPGPHLAVRKAGGPGQEYDPVLAIPGVRGTGSSGGGS